MLHPSPMCTAVIAQQPWVLPGMPVLPSVSLQFSPVISLIRSRSCLRRFNWGLSAFWDMTMSLCDGDWDQQFVVITLLLICHYNCRAGSCFDISDCRQHKPCVSASIWAPDRRMGKSDPVYTKIFCLVAWVTALFLGLSPSPGCFYPSPLGICQMCLFSGLFWHNSPCGRRGNARVERQPPGSGGCSSQRCGVQHGSAHPNGELGAGQVLHPCVGPDVLSEPRSKCFQLSGSANPEHPEAFSSQPKGKTRDL